MCIVTRMSGHLPLVARAGIVAPVAVVIVTTRSVLCVAAISVNGIAPARLLHTRRHHVRPQSE